MVQINDVFQYQWSKTVGFFTHNKDDVISKHVNNNDLWYISEKLDGSNMAVSSDGYIASRHRIIADCDTIKKFQGFSLEHILPLFEKVNDLQEHLKIAFFSKFNFKVILYGEFMQEGTANSKFDFYNYVQRGYDPGHLYAFGIALIFDEITQDVKSTVQRIFKQAFIHSSTENTKFYLVPMDWFLTGLFYKFNIECVRLHSVQELQNVFARPDIMMPVLERQVEGYILSSLTGHGMLKLKTAPPKSTFVDTHMEKLENIHTPTLNALRRIYDSSDYFFNVFDRETFTSYFNAIFEQEREFIKKSIMSELLYDDEFHTVKWSKMDFQTVRLLGMVVQKMEDHYTKQLHPQVKCEMKMKIKKKLYITLNSLYHSKPNE